MGSVASLELPHGVLTNVEHVSGRDGRVGYSSDLDSARGLANAQANAPARRVSFVVADLANAVVSSLAPDQHDLLAAVTQRWARGQLPRRRRWSWFGGSVGFGVDPAVLSEVIYPLLTATLAQVAGDVVLTAWLRRRWWRRHFAAGTPNPPQVLVSLDERQLDALRAACVTHAVTLGLSKARAAVLADAIHGAVCRELAKGNDLA